MKSFDELSSESQHHINVILAALQAKGEQVGRATVMGVIVSVAEDITSGHEIDALSAFGATKVLMSLRVPEDYARELVEVVAAEGRATVLGINIKKDDDSQTFTVISR